MMEVRLQFLRIIERIFKMLLSIIIIFVVELWLKYFQYEEGKEIHYEIIT